MIKKHHLYQYVATHTHNKTERYTLLESKWYMQPIWLY
jgi:hypothetical protein